MDSLVASLQVKVVCGSSDTGKGRSKMPKQITHGFHMVKGKSNHAMEDYVVSEFKQVSDNKLGLFAIFDGHLGHDVASYLQIHLFDNILKQVIHISSRRMQLYFLHMILENFILFQWLLSLSNF